MKRRNTASRQQKRRRTQRGAALIFALVAVIVIVTLTLATGRLIGGHLALEQNAEGYSRAINIAEAAANWQLNRMSRSKLPGDTTTIPGRLNYDEVNTWNEATDSPDPYIGTLPSSETGTDIAGNVKVWVRTAAIGGKWTAPGYFALSALGQDPKTGITRGVQLNGQPIGLSDQYALFGQNELRFDSQSAIVGADTGAAQLLRGYVGSNGRVWSRDAAPMPRGGAQYFGCRLGPNALLSPTGSSWPSGWDFPRLPDPVQLPTVDQVISFMYRGRSADDCAAANDNNQIDYLDSTGNFLPLRQSGNVVTQLTDTEFNQSPVRTLRLRASESAVNGNLFYFTSIQMQPGDVLILDSRQVYPSSGLLQRSMRILINNSDPNSGTLITNLAYFRSTLALQTAGDQDPPVQSYYWFNNTAGAFVFKPTRAADPNFYIPPGYLPATTPFKIQLEPTLRGIVYGVNSYTAPGNAAGNITVYGKTAIPVKVRSLIGNHVTLLGPVQVEWDSAEDKRNPNMYVLYYSILNRTHGELDPNVNPFNLNEPGYMASPAYDYGR